MTSQKPGILKNSTLYDLTPSDTAREIYYYITSCGHFYCDGRYLVERSNYHNFLALYVVHGKLSITVEGETHTILPKCGAFINCHHPHRYASIGEAEFLWVHFDGCNTGRLHRHITHELYHSVAFPMDEGLHQDIAYIVRCCRQDKQWIKETEFSRCLYSLLIRMADQENSAPPLQEENSFISRTYQYVNDHIKEPLQVQELAEQVNMSPQHFSRKFKKSTGYSPHEYLTMTRINLAKRLLTSSDLSIKEIGFTVGYNSECNFIRAFKQRVAMSPTQFRSVVDL